MRSRYVQLDYSKAHKSTAQHNTTVSREDQTVCCATLHLITRNYYLLGIISWTDSSIMENEIWRNNATLSNND